MEILNFVTVFTDIVVYYIKSPDNTGVFIYKDKIIKARAEGLDEW